MYTYYYKILSYQWPKLCSWGCSAKNTNISMFSSQFKYMLISFAFTQNNEFNLTWTICPCSSSWVSSHTKNTHTHWVKLRGGQGRRRRTNVYIYRVRSRQNGRLVSMLYSSITSNVSIHIKCLHSFRVLLHTQTHKKQLLFSVCSCPPSVCFCIVSLCLVLVIVAEWLRW